MAAELAFLSRVPLFAIYQFDEVGEAVGGLGTTAGQQVLVGVNCERRAHVPESF